ncbi:PAS domain-containing protein [Candidatus Bathyarchaeota archaeon]|nr:PAS domain-containing protein [Candidatus Bathyarchaeota archaeon]
MTKTQYLQMDSPDRRNRDILRELILESQLELTESGVSVINKQDKIVYWNRSFLEIFDFKEKDVENKPHGKVFEKTIEKLENPDEFKETMNKTYRDPKHQGTDITRFKNGKIIERKTTPLLKDGRYYGRIWYFTDLTEQKQREREMETYTNELQRMVANRTQELIEAEKMVASGSMASEIAHDLRSPLQSIRNATYMMKKNPDKVDVGLEIIEKSISRSLEMLETLRGNTRQSEPKLRRTDLNKIIKESVDELPKPGDVTVHVELDKEVEAWIDGSQIRRVFDNILLNAVEAMHSGGTITITKQREETKFIIQISDTGVGIPEQVLPNLFERKFYTTKPYGLGLGLSYCKRTIESHGGKIMVDSVQGKGTVFTIELPRIP